LTAIHHQTANVFDSNPFFALVVVFGMGNEKFKGFGEIFDFFIHFIDLNFF
jgi:hypothetical protein